VRSKPLLSTVRRSIIPIARDKPQHQRRSESRGRRRRLLPSGPLTQVPGTFSFGTFSFGHLFFRHLFFR
jgi:hypothetical protein